jgi:hypothetical protein
VLQPKIFKNSVEMFYSIGNEDAWKLWSRSQSFPCKMDKSVRIQEEIIKENFTMEVRSSVESNPLHTYLLTYSMEQSPS